jgi:Protein of unknown function (DUF998)
LSLVALVLVLAGALVLVRLHTLPAGISPIRDAVSDYGATAFHIYYRAMVVLLGAGAGFLAIALRDNGDVSRSGRVWLWVFALSRIAIAGFMTVRPGRRVALAFTAIAFAAPKISGDLELAQPLATLIIVAAVATLIARIVPRLAGVFGVVERALYATFLSWLVVVAISLL